MDQKGGVVLYEVVVRNVKFIDAKSFKHIGIIDEKFATLTTDKIHGEKEFDAKGDIVLPPFVEMHTHLDTALTVGNDVENQTGTLSEGIEIWSNRKTELTDEDVSKRAMKVIMKLVQNGVLSVRAAVDISDPGLIALKALVELRNKVSHVIDLQIIAFPQDGLISCPENQQRLIQAIELGADVVSAVPHLESTRENGIKSLEYCFSVAKKYHTYIHIFCDEMDDAHSRFLEVVAELALKDNLGEKVTASHANALAYYSDVYSSKVISLVRQAGISVVACPLVNSVMQGRFDPFPKGRGITRVKELNEANVNVCIAHDDIQSPFYPFGNGNILQAAYMAAHLAHMTGSNDLEELIKMITLNAAKAFNPDKHYGIEIGKPANFITVPGENLADVFCNHPKCRFVFKEGKLVASTVPEETIWGSIVTDHMLLSQK